MDLGECKNISVLYTEEKQVPATTSFITPPVDGETPDLTRQKNALKNVSVQLKTVGAVAVSDLCLVGTAGGHRGGRWWLRK